MKFMRLLLVTGAVLALSAHAWAINIPGSVNVEMKFTNWDMGTVYHNLVEGTVYDATAIPTTDPGSSGVWKSTPMGAYAGEDIWGIYKLNLITDASDPSIIYWDANNTTAWNTRRSEITGIFWGADDVWVTQNAGIQEIHATGMKYAFFEDFNIDFVTTGGTAPQEIGGGPANRGEKFAGGDAKAPVWTIATNDGADAGADGQVGTADDTRPIWTGVSTPGYNTAYPTHEFFSNYNPSATGYTGGGGFFGKMGEVPYWGTGTRNDMWKELVSGDGYSYNMDFAFTGDNRGKGSWLVKSNDPVRAATPELPTTALMLIGLVPVGLAWMRRKKED